MMNPLSDVTFIRRFSVNFHKNMFLPLGEMSCHKDWVHAQWGDPYPLTAPTVLTERIENGGYRIENPTAQSASVERVLGVHFPYASCRMTLHELSESEEGGVGFSFVSGDDRVKALIRNTGNGLHITIGNDTFDTDIPFTKDTVFTVTCRCRYFDLYVGHRYVGTADIPAFERTAYYDTYMRSCICLCAELKAGATAFVNCDWCLDCGISQADTRCVCYEDGTPIYENGRVFLTLSARAQEGGHQVVVSWCPTTGDIRMEGALFFDVGDGRINSDIASCLIYDRRTKEWLLWACAFSHGHILFRGKSDTDLRFGINILDVKMMDTEFRNKDGAWDLSDDRLFLGKCGDEDPDLVWDEETQKWKLLICRVVRIGEGQTAYRYFLFESNDPFDGFTYVDSTEAGSLTGGSVVTLKGKKYLICGGDFRQRSHYYIQPLSDLKEHALLSFNYDDGGFRGWGTVIPLRIAGRERLFMMTFDRHNGSSYNWSYGNLYAFEAVNNPKKLTTKDPSFR